MNKIKNYFVALVLAFVAISCGVKQYQSQEFVTRTKNHKTVAVLPPMVQYVQSGIIAIDLGTDKKQQMYNESMGLQKHLYQKLLQQKNTKNPITVNFQDINRTNELLKKKNITHNQTLEKSPEELAKILGVDAVVISKVEKEIMLDDKIMKVANVGRNVINVLGGGTVNTNDKSGLVKAGTIKISSTLNDATDGFVLWNSWKDFDITLDNMPEDILNQYGNQCARSFPYRLKK